MSFIDYDQIIRNAWNDFNAKKRILKIEDISAKVSTNHVFRIHFAKGDIIIAKLSYFGRHEFFVEDHRIINTLANNLRYPFDQFIAKSLHKGNELYCYRYKEGVLDVWVVFYNPIRIKVRPPQVFNEEQIRISGRQLALFHEACLDIVEELPPSQKTLESDILELKAMATIPDPYGEYAMYAEEIEKQCNLFLKNSEKLSYKDFDRIPVFIDWNIGNFSVDEQFKLYSRWDYDWFRVTSRMLDFYFWARVVRKEGDQKNFSYTTDPFTEDRFVLFLQSYHSIHPLQENELLFIKEAYRFFLLHYVVRLGTYFFLDHYAIRLKKETFLNYFKDIEKFRPEKLVELVH